MRLTILGVALLASASAIGEGYITSVRLPDGTTKTFQDAGARQEIQDILSQKYLKPESVKAGDNVSVTTNEYGDVTISADIASTSPAFSNAVLSVGLGIDTNTVAAINELVDSTHGLPVTGAASVGALLLALSAAIAALKRGKTDKADLALRPAMFDIGGGVWVFANDGEGFVVINGEVTTLPASKTIFGSYEYYENSNLTLVYAPNVATIGNGAFSDCTALASVSLPAATSIGDEAFYSCTALASVSLPAATIGESAFSDCTALAAVSLPAATTIGESAFYSCTSLTSVSLPAAASIGVAAFSDCTALTSVSLPAAASIGDEAFYSCTSLTSVSLPATTIGESAFERCDSLTSISLPAATTIGIYAFNDCSALTTIDLSSFTVAQVKENALTWGINPPSGHTVTITCSDGTFTITGD